jgi:hypothetical protein
VNNQAVALAICSSDLTAAKLIEEELKLDDVTALAVVKIVSEDKAKISRLAYDLIKREKEIALK